jgi:hypothetical protein
VWKRIAAHSGVSESIVSFDDSIPESAPGTIVVARHLDERQVNLGHVSLKGYVGSGLCFLLAQPFTFTLPPKLVEFLFFQCAASELCGNEFVAWEMAHLFSQG